MSSGGARCLARPYSLLAFWYSLRPRLVRPRRQSRRRSRQCWQRFVNYARTSKHRRLPQEGRRFLSTGYVQEAAVAHASQRLDEAKSSAEQLRARRKYQEIQIKQYETLKGRAENAAQGQQFEDAIFGAQGTDGSIGGRGKRGE